MSALNIINRLINAGMSVNGALGMWGNIDKESEGGRANNAENGRSPYDDETYTRYADEGRINFVYDGIGYGLCQWTFWSRKQGLYNLAKSRGLSVGDENVQVDFLVSELQQPQYREVWEACCNPNISIYDATHVVCVKFEKPARDTTDQRYQLAMDAYNTYKDQLDGHAEPAPEPEPVPAEPVTLPTIRRGDKGVVVAMLQIALKCHGYWSGVLPSWADGNFGSGTESKLKQFQQKNGIAADGVCGPQTWYCLLKK